MHNSAPSEIEMFIPMMEGVDLQAMTKGKLLALGRTAEVYEWRDGQVLKLFYDWCPADWAKHEASIAGIVNAKWVDAPKFIETATIDGRNGIIFERVNGISMLSLMSKDPLQIRKQARLFAELQSEINSSTGEDLPAMRPYLESSIAQGASLCEEMKSQLLSRLADLRDGTSLCHMDFHPDQVLICARGPVVLDWITALQGNRMADIARSMVLLQFAQALHLNWMAHSAVNLFRRIFTRAYLKRCMELHHDISDAEINKWMVVVAAARLKEGIKEEQGVILQYIKRELAQ